MKKFRFLRFNTNSEIKLLRMMEIRLICSIKNGIIVKSAGTADVAIFSTDGICSQHAL